MCLKTPQLMLENLNFIGVMSSNSPTFIALAHSRFTFWPVIFLLNRSLSDWKLAISSPLSFYRRPSRSSSMPMQKLRARRACYAGVTRSERSSSRAIKWRIGRHLWSRFSGKCLRLDGSYDKVGAVKPWISDATAAKCRRKSSEVGLLSL